MKNNKQNHPSVKTVTLYKLIKVMFNSNKWSAIDSYLKYYNHLRKVNGLKYTVKYFKTVKLHITRYICNQPLRKNNANVSIDPDGWPTKFKYLKPLVDSTDGLRILMSILSYNRSVKPTKEELKTIEPDYSTITNKGIDKFYTIPKTFIVDWVNKHQLSQPLPIYSDRNHFINPKSSPNGPSTFSAFWSWKALSLETKEYLKGILGSYWTNIQEQLDSYNKTSYKYTEGKEGLTKYSGKLSIKNDPELKLRVFAMIDYYSQFALKPIHDSLFNCLKKLPCDRTFTQDPFHNWSASEDNFYSLDLSAATDRFPIHLQSKLLLYIFGDVKFAKNWEKLLVDRDYATPNGDLLRYAVGQPMGAYSSWPAFTLCHHLVIAWAAKLSGIDNFTDYLVLGDDVVIKGDRVAQRYIGIITKLGVEVSVTKTHKSKDTYEFAKRWIKGNTEITGIPLKGLTSHWDNLGVVYTMLFNYIRQLKLPVIPLDLICKIYSGSLRIQGKGSNKRWVKSTYSSLHKRLYDFDMANRYVKGELTNQTLRQYLVNKWPKDKFFWLPTDSSIPLFVKGLLSMGVREMAIKTIDSVWGSSTEVHKQLADTTSDIDKAIILSGSPMMKGLLNHLYNLNDYFNNQRSLDELDFLDLINALRIEEVDKIVLMNRDVHTKVEVLNKLWVKSFKLLRYWPTRDEVDRGATSKELLSVREMTDLVAGEEDTYWQENGHNTLKTAITDFEFLCTPTAWNSPTDIDLPMDLSVALNKKLSSLTFLRDSNKAFCSYGGHRWL